MILWAPCGMAIPQGASPRLWLISKPLSHLMQTLNILLFNVFLRHIAHTGATASFHNCNGIIFIVFTAHPEGLYILWADLPDVVSVLPELPVPVICTSTCSRPNTRRMDRRKHLNRNLRFCPLCRLSTYQ